MSSIQGGCKASGCAPHVQWTLWAYQHVRIDAAGALHASSELTGWWMEGLARVPAFIQLLSLGDERCCMSSLLPCCWIWGGGGGMNNEHALSLGFGAMQKQRLTGIQDLSKAGVIILLLAVRHMYSELSLLTSTPPILGSQIHHDIIVLHK